MRTNKKRSAHRWCDKKGQVYGLSAFLYALAIAIILIVGLIGLSKEYDLKSSAGLYRFSSVITTKNAEIVKKLMDQERGYAVDKSLYITGAFGGYSPNIDLLCNEALTCGAPDNKCCIGSVCKSSTYFNKCFPNVTSGSGFCGALKNDASFLGEKIVPYWKYDSTKCVPSTTFMLEKTFSKFAGQTFSQPSELLSGAISAATRTPLRMQYIMSIDDWDENTGLLETSWFVDQVGSGLRFTAPPPPDDPVVEYTFKPFIHLFSNTSFFELHKEAKAFVDGSEFAKILSNESSPIPTVIDEDFNANAVPADVARPFRALVAYAIALPDSPNGCTSDELASLDASKVSASYSKDCTILAKSNSDGALIFDSFTSTSGCLSTSTDDDKAIRCTMKRVLNNINLQLKLDSGGSAIGPQDSNAGWKYQLKTFNLTFKGAPTPGASTASYFSSYKYTTSQPGVFPGACTIDVCPDAVCVGPAGAHSGGYKYCSQDIYLEGNVTTSPQTCSSRTSGKVNADVWVRARASSVSAAPECLAAYNVTVSADATGNCASQSLSRVLLINGTGTNHSLFTFTNFDASCAATKTVFNISNSSVYPGDTDVLNSGIAKLAYCQELSQGYFADIPETTPFHRGGYACSTNSQCASPNECAVNNVCSPCGATDQACCLGDTCDSGLACDAATKTCKVPPPSCGKSGEPCCTTGSKCSVTGLACNNDDPSKGMCVSPCGGNDQLCCTNPWNPACGSSLSCYSNGANPDTCQCGAFDQPCCSGSTCDTSSLRCNTGTGKCVNCGGNTQPCCSASPYCSPPSSLACNTDTAPPPISNNCVSCGANGQPCCSSTICNSGVGCDLTPNPNTCTDNCGDLDEPCCAGSSPCKDDPNLSCDGSTNKCVSCGQIGLPCCASDVCKVQFSVCTGTPKTCQYCDSAGDACCYDSSVPTSYCTGFNNCNTQTGTCQDCGGIGDTCCTIPYNLDKCIFSNYDCCFIDNKCKIETDICFTGG